MVDKPLFIKDCERERLRKIYSQIAILKDRISSEYEEYSAINTSLYYLKNAIEYKDKYY